jgi:hypothetical protein
VKWLMHACPSARTIHTHVRQTNPCRAECLVVCSHMDRHHQRFHRHPPSHLRFVTRTYVNTFSTSKNTTRALLHTQIFTERK